MTINIEAEIAKFESKHAIGNYETESMMAQLMIQKSKNYIKSKIHTHPLCDRFMAATNLIHDTYPEADRKLVRKSLIGIGIYPPIYIFFYFLLLLIFFSVGASATIFVIPIDPIFKLALGIIVFITTIIFLINIMTEYLGE